MLDVIGRFVRRFLGLPAGVGVLFDRAMRVRLAIAVAGSILVALADVIAVAAVLPLIQLFTGASTDSGVLGRVSDVFGDPGRDQLAMYLAVVVFAGFLLRSMLTVAFRWWMLGLVMDQEVATATGVLRYYLHAPYSFHQRKHTAELIRTMNDAVGQVYSQVVIGAISALSELASITLMLALLLVVSPAPSLIVIAYFGVAVLAFQRWSRPRLEVASERLMLSFVSIYRAALHGLGAIKEVTLRGSQEHFLRDYRLARAEAASARRFTSFVTEMPKHAMEILFIGGVALMTLLLFAGEEDSSALGMLALFAAAGFRILPGAVRFLASLSAMKGGSKGLALVLEDVRASQEYLAGYGRTRTPVPTRTAITLDGVRFAYPGGEEVLRGIDLEIPAGSSLALVGGSGAGKTTLVDLLLGLHSPTRGTILQDGVDIAERLPDWQAGIGLVPQQVFLTDGTLRENVALGVDEAEIDDARVDEALRQAQLSDIVAALPERLSTSVGEQGGRLSGGQRQRIGIARALYHQPTMLVLDEATSALDNETERRITETMASLHGRMTLVVVAHRLSTVKGCDQVAYLKDGRVEAYGTFAQVRERSADFAHLVALGDLSGDLTS